jgi:hypothetical protein
MNQSLYFTLRVISPPKNKKGRDKPALSLKIALESRELAYFEKLATASASVL